MKAICIGNDGANAHNLFEIPIGEMVIIDGVSQTAEDHYYIREYPFSKRGRKAAYWNINFIPLSDIDETELVKQREEECIS